MRFGPRKRCRVVSEESVSSKSVVFFEKISRGPFLTSSKYNTCGSCGESSGGRDKGVKLKEEVTVSLECE